MERTYKKRTVKPKVTKPKYTMESLEAMSTEELYKLGTNVKDNPKEETLQVAIVTVLGRKDIHNPEF